MAEIAGCYGCKKAQWDTDGCTCGIDGLLVGNAAKGCTYRIYDEEPETVSDDYERGFKDGLKSECLKELKPAMDKLIEGCTEAIKSITPMMIENAQLYITHAVNRWIPCSERLPENRERVLVCFRSGAVHIAVWWGDYDEKGAWKVTSQFPTKLYRTDTIPKWMPMPDAYEPPESEVHRDAKTKP